MRQDRDRLKIFNKVLSTLRIDDHHFLFVFHLSRNNHLYLRQWLKKFSNLGVISIPYSEITEVGIDIEKVTTLFRPKLNEISELILEICNKHKDKKIISIEIGGYSAEIADKLKNVKLVIEDTNQGYWNFTNHKHKLNFPVVSISQTEVKKLENILIGQSIVYSTETLLRKHFHQDFLAGKNVFVISYGGIGYAVCKALQARQAKVLVYDRDSIKMSMAYLDGFRIVEKRTGLENADIVIGCSGNRSLKMSDLRLLRNGALLISGSSKQIEFPYEELTSFIKHKSEDEEIEFADYEGKKFYIAYKGQPINFLHDSALSDVFDLQMSLLLQSVKYGLTNKLENKIYMLPLEYQYPLTEIYIKDKLNLS